MKKLILIVLFLSIKIHLFSQEFTDEQKYEIRDSVLALLEQYAEYADFTKDGISISETYINGFISLFSEEALLVNDISDSYQMISPESFTEIAKKNFPAGTEVKLQTDSAYFKNLLRIDKNSCSLQVDLKKYTVGILNGNKIFRKDINASFTIRFSCNEKTFSDFKITEINSKELILKRKSDKKMKGVFVGLNGTASASGLHISDNINYYERAYRFSPAFSAGISADYWLSSHYGLSLGVNYSVFKSNFDTRYNNEMNNNLPGIDIDNHEYFLYVNADVTEKTTLTYVSVPLRFKFRQKLYDQFSFFASLGIAASYLLSSESYVNGTSSHSAWYDEFNLIVDEAPLYNLGDLIYDDTYAFETAHLFLSAEIEAGVSIPINEKAFLNFGVNIRHSFSNLNYNTSSYRDDYVYLHGEPNNMFLRSSGLFISYNRKF